MTSRNLTAGVQIPADVTRILVVEGPEDKTFFCGLAEQLGISKELYIVVCNGKDKLEPVLKSILNDGNFHSFEHIGIICDNDFPDIRNNRSALRVVQDEIDSANVSINEIVKSRRQLPRPENPRVPAGTKPKVSVLLLPNDERDGMLEDLVLEAIGKNDITNCVDEYFTCLNNTGLSAREARKSRSRLSVYISGKILDSRYATNDDSRRWFLTQAVDMKWWKAENMWDNSTFDDAKAFLRQLLAE
ncbi:MAG: hypothetical protein OXT68_11385 [Chloroflexota bacterium]|nr:hypothetical protein [Chloroflexota bacterium]